MKYQPYGKIDLVNRTWPNNEIQKAPIWCSVDLRDGNQALIKPMNIDEKLKLFKLLVEVGFKQIEIGFPSASATEFEFARRLIEDGLIPDDVTIQVLVQAREHLIKKTYEALNGAKNIIVHLYNSTSIAQRKIVFKKNKEEIIELAILGVRSIKEHFNSFPGNVTLEYSPESFTGTELEFARDICDVVIEEWNPKDKMIINLPATVEMATPNIYADQIEWMCANLKHRDKAIISLHAHNDRGTAVGATELGLLAGANRVEGTLLGNGERTGNVDIITLALNMYTQGIDSKLKFHNIDKVRKIVEEVTNIQTHIRHPYAGDMVYTAFSGSHQDAIKKGFECRKESNDKWEVPYLPIDPSDVGRDYEAIIMINSQSGKGGVAYILKNQFGYKLPKKMEPYVGAIIQAKSDQVDRVLKNEEIYEEFQNYFVNQNDFFDITNIHISTKDSKVNFKADFKVRGENSTQEISSNGNIEAICEILSKFDMDISVQEYSEHSLNSGADATAVAYFGISRYGQTYYGVGIDDNISIASIKALISAINIAMK